MNNKELEQLFKLLAETDIYEFELDKLNTKVKIRRGHIAPAMAPVTVAAPIPISKMEDIPPYAKGGVENEKNKNIKYIVSPMVGTFYRAPSTDAKPYVEKGDTINKGQIMCIIEAMKLFNEIEANIGGKLVEILIENGSPVEYGEKLFAIEVN